MPENKTKLSEASVADHLAAIENVSRRKDCEALAQLMSRASGEPAKMWGPSIVGFGIHAYRYESGRKGEICRVGFASRTRDIAIYGLNAAPGADALIAALGKHKQGKSCLYIGRLGDIDTNVLEQLVARASRSVAA